jgi:hypothetical protein
VSDPPLTDVEAALEEKLPGHTFRAVVRRADALPAGEREELLRDALANRERDEEWTEKQPKRKTSNVGRSGGRASAGGTK